MNDDKKIDISDAFSLICPGCGVGNPEGTEYCIFCDKDLKETILFLEDNSFDLEITKEFLIEYKKKFWGEERSGKVNRYKLNKIKNIKIGSPISRFIFEYSEKRVVLPFKKENLKKIKEYFKVE